jgi:betaine lipid synthase
MHKLSPYMSSHAFKFWLSHGPRIFAGQGLFYSAGLRRVVKLAKRLLFLTGRSAAGKRLAEARTLDEQKEIWDQTIRSVALSHSLHSFIVGNKQWPWSMSKQQRGMIMEDVVSRKGSSEDQALWGYLADTLDPVARSMLLSEDNHYYRLCLLGNYSRRCHPDYMQPSSHAELSRANAFDGLRIYTDEMTDEMTEVIARMSPGTLTIAVIMDAMDWLDPEGMEADAQIRVLNKALAMRGRVLLKSVGLRPWYIPKFEQLGFQPKCHRLREPGTCIDR